MSVVKPGARSRYRRLVAVGLTVAAGTAGTAGSTGTSAAATPGGETVPAAAAAATTYRYVDLGVLNPRDPRERQQSSAVDLNEAGQVVGSSTANTATGSWFRGFGWRNGVLRDVGSGAGYSSSADGVNESGTVVGGTTFSADQPQHAFVRRNGVLVDLGTGYGSGSSSSAVAINDKGAIVGSRHDKDGAPTRATLWTGGRLIDLGTLGGRTGIRYGTDSEAYAINNLGQVVGVALPEGGAPLRGFLWRNGRMRDLGTLGGTTEATQALDINDNSVVVGSSQRADGETRAFLWRNGSMRDLGALGPDHRFRGSTAHGINNNGVVVGTTKIKGNCHPVGSCPRAFVWNGAMRDLNSITSGIPDGRRLRAANEINDKGVIVGTSCLIAGCERTDLPYDGDRAFMLVPQKAAAA